MEINSDDVPLVIFFSMKALQVRMAAAGLFPGRHLSEKVSLMPFFCHDRLNPPAAAARCTWHVVVVVVVVANIPLQQQGRDPLYPQDPIEIKKKKVS